MSRLSFFCIRLYRPISLAEFAALPQIDTICFSSDMSSEWACSTPQPRSGATALHPRPHSSSQNQSTCFDFERSRSAMSFLSRLRGRKGYGACGDAAMEREYSNGKPSEAGFRLRAKRQKHEWHGVTVPFACWGWRKRRKKKMGKQSNKDCDVLLTYSKYHLNLNSTLKYLKFDWIIS